MNIYDLDFNFDRNLSRATESPKSRKGFSWLRSFATDEEVPPESKPSSEQLPRKNFAHDETGHFHFAENRTF